MQGSSPQSLHPLASFVPELLHPRLARCPPALLHLAAPYPHPAPSGDDCSQKSHAQPPGQYPVAKGCQSDLCPERQSIMTLALGSRGPSLSCPSEVSASITPTTPGWGPSQSTPARLYPLSPPYQHGFIHPFPDTSLQKKKKKKELAKTTSTTITIPFCGLRIWTRGTARPKGRAILPLLKKKGGRRRHFSFREWESLKTWFVESWPWQARVNCQAKLLRSGQTCISLWCHFICIKGWGGLERKIPAFATT